MLGAQEEIAVAQGGLHHRHLQPHQHVGGGRIVLHLAFDLVVQQVEQFEGVRIRAGQRGIGSMLRAGGFDIREEVTSDGLSELMADTINAMSEAAYAQYLRWHFYMCGQPGFLSAGNHLLFKAVKA